MSRSAVVHVDPSNADQLSAWDGEEGEYWAANAERFDRALDAYHRPFLDACVIGTTDRVLDIGCGTGKTTRDAARLAVDGAALGIDLSSTMVELARQLATDEGVSNASFEQADAQIHPFAAASFDVAISRTGAMFFGDPVAAFANVGRALRPGGRLILLTWQPPVANDWIQEISRALAAGRDLPAPSADARGPFSLSDPERAAAVLTAAGLADVTFDAASRPMWFGSNADEAHRFVVGLMGWMMDGLDERDRARALGDLRHTLLAHESADGVMFTSGVWTIRASA